MVLLPIVVVSLVLVALSARGSQRIAEDLGAQLVHNAVTQVGREVERYLAAAVRTSDLYTRRVEHGGLSTSDLSSWRQPMLDDLVSNPDVASICFANPAGDATWLLRHGDRLEIGLVDGSRVDEAVEHTIDPETAAESTEPLRVYKYEAKARPWYTAALAAGRPCWTPVYFWFGDSGGASVIGTGYTRPIHTAGSELAGVLVIDITLGGLTNYLRTLPLAKRGHVYIVDEAGLLVAASDGEVTSADGKRLPLSESNSSAARSAAIPLSKHSEAATVAVTVGGEPARLSVTTMRPYPGIDWRVLTVLPDREFLAHADSLRNRSLALAAGAVLGSLLLGFAVSRQLTKPLLRLTEFIRRVAAGDFASRLDLNAAAELAEVSQELNVMSAGLKQRLELERSLGLATEVQQCLLPSSNPSPPLLDVASRSRYCDTTGGDYFDFIDVATLGEEGLLIAVGDVTGHGIASALVMASARAAVRAYAFQEGNLANLMTKVNRVFAADTQHGRFMTLAVMVIDRQATTVRWASAGHDPAIIYDPITDKFSELEGGGLPLGVVDGYEYEEQSAAILQPGVVLLLGTDGIWETTNAAGEAYGKERMRDAIRAARDETAQQITDAVEADLSSFRGPASILDDITYVVIKRRPPNS